MENKFVVTEKDIANLSAMVDMYRKIADTKRKQGWLGKMREAELMAKVWQEAIDYIVACKR